MHLSTTEPRLRTGILIFEDIEVLDFTGPYEIFSRTRLEPGVASRRSDATAPFDVFTVARTHDAVRTVGGLQVLPDHAFADCPEVDLLVVPGGFGTRRLLEDEEVLAWIRERAAAARWVTSVCTGALLLAQAGLLRGKRATTHWSSLDFLASLDETIDVRRGERYVHDGAVTSAGVAAGMDMALSVVEAICGREVADETAQYIELPRSPRTV